MAAQHAVPCPCISSRSEKPRVSLCRHWGWQQLPSPSPAMDLPTPGASSIPYGSQSLPGPHAPSGDGRGSGQLVRSSETPIPTAAKRDRKDTLVLGSTGSAVPSRRPSTVCYGRAAAHCRQPKGTLPAVSNRHQRGSEHLPERGSRARVTSLAMGCDRDI